MMPVGYGANLDIPGAGLRHRPRELIHSARLIRPTATVHTSTGKFATGRRLSGTGTNTLVVETTNCRQNTIPEFDAALKVIERFTRTDAETVDYQFTVEDPNTWTRPWTAAVPPRKVQTDLRITLPGATTGSEILSCARWKTRRRRV